MHVEGGQHGTVGLHTAALRPPMNADPEQHQPSLLVVPGSWRTFSFQAVWGPPSRRHAALTPSVGRWELYCDESQARGVNETGARAHGSVSNRREGQALTEHQQIHVGGTPGNAQERLLRPPGRG